MHHQDGARECAGIHVGRRHRDPSGQPTRARRRAGSHGVVARSVWLSLLHDVSGVAESLAVDAREPRRRRGAQPDRRPGRAEAMDEDCARSDVVDSVNLVGADLRVRPRTDTSVGPYMLQRIPRRKYDPSVLPDSSTRLRSGLGLSKARLKEDVQWLTRFRLFRIRLMRSNLTSTNRRWRFITGSITTRTSRI